MRAPFGIAWYPTRRLLGLPPSPSWSPPPAAPPPPPSLAPQPTAATIASAARSASAARRSPPISSALIATLPSRPSEPRNGAALGCLDDGVEQHARDADDDDPHEDVARLQ